MKTNRKTLKVVASLVLTLLMCLSIVPVSAMAMVEGVPPTEDPVIETPVEDVTPVQDTTPEGGADVVVTEPEPTPEPTPEPALLPESSFAAANAFMASDNAATTYTVEYKVDGASVGKNEGLQAEASFPAPPSDYIGYTWAYDDAGAPYTFVWDDSAQPQTIGTRDWELTGTPPETIEPSPETENRNWNVIFEAAVEGQANVPATIQVTATGSETDGFSYTLTQADLDRGVSALNAALASLDLQVDALADGALGAVITSDNHTVAASAKALTATEAPEDEDDEEEETDVTVFTVTLVNGDSAQDYNIEKDALLPKPENPAPDQNMKSFLGWFYTEDGIGEYDFSTPVESSFTLYAVFSDKYIVSFKDARGLVYETQVVAESETASPPVNGNPDPIESGLVFQYWYLEGDESQTAYNFSQPVYSSFSLAPMFGNFHYVFFNTAGGILADDDGYEAVVEDGDKVPQPDDPSRAGYTFAFWSEDKDAIAEDIDTKAFDFDTEVHETLYLYAIWAPDTAKYKVVYWYEKANLPVGMNPDDKNNYETVYVDTSLPAVETGSTVTVLEEDVSAAAIKQMPFSKYYASDVDVEVMGDGTSVVNVYYTRDIFHLTFNTTNALGKSDTPPADIYIAGDKNVGRDYTIDIKLGMNVSATWPTKLVYDDSSYYFTTWSSYYGMQTVEINESALSVAFGDPKATTDGQTVYTLSTFYYGGTQGVRHNVTLVNRSTQNPWFETRFYYTELSAEELAAYNAGQLTADVRPWTSPNDGVTKYYQYYSTAEVDKTQTGSPGTSNDTPGTTLPQYVGGARGWPGRSIPGFYTINAKATGGTYITTNYQEIYCSSERHYDLYYYMPRKSNTLTLITTGAGGNGVIDDPGSFTGGNGTYTATVPYGTNLDTLLPDNMSIDNQEYTFVGWFTDAKFTSPYVAKTTMPDSAMVLYAKFQIGSYNVKYYEKAGSTNALDTINYGKYETIDKTSYTRYEVGKGYPGLGIFQGWGRYLWGVLTPYEYSTPITADLELYGLWKTNGFTIKYKANGGTGDVPTDGGAYALNVNALLQSGSGLSSATGEFIGWRIENGNGAIYFPGSALTMYDNFVMVAVYADTDQVVQVNFHPNYETTDASKTVNAIKNSHAMPLGSDAFTRTGYSLIGWSDTEGGANVAYPFGKAFPVGETTMNLYAVWQSDALYKITFNVWANGGGAVGGAPSVTKYVRAGGTLSSASWPTPNPDSNHYFNGWDTDGDGQLNASTAYALTNVESDQVIVAQFPAKAVLDVPSLQVANQIKTYGQADPANSFTNWPQDVDQNDFTITFSRTGGDNVVLGGYPISATVTVKPEEAHRYSTNGARAKSGTLTINKAVLTPAISDVPATVTYGDALDLTGIRYSYTGYVNGDQAADVAIAYEADPALYTNYTAGDDVNSYSVYLRAGEAQNYTALATDTTFAVKAKVLDVSGLAVDNFTKLYSAQDPTFNFTIQSLAAFEGDWTQIESEFTRATGENVGPYAIGASLTATTDNYILTGAVTNTGTLTINKLPLTLTPVGSGKAYGEKDPNPVTRVTEDYQLLLNPLVDENFTMDTPVYTAARATGEELGAYDITVSFDANQNPNYDITVNKAVFTISQAGSPIVINMGSFTKIYGDADPTPAQVANTLTVSNLVGGDTADMLGLSVTRTPGEDVGAYTYTITYDPAVAAKYSGVTVNAGAMVITQRHVRLYANDQPQQGVIYPTDALPAFTAYIDPNTPLAFNDQLMYSLYLTDYNGAGTPGAGAYNIGFNLDPNDPMNRNYDIWVADGALTITAAPAPVTPDEGTTDPTTPVPTPAPVAPAPGGGAPAIVTPVVVPATAATAATAPLPAATTPQAAPPNAPLVDFDGSDVPLASTVTAQWALINLLVAVLALVLGVLMFATMFKRNKKRDETDEDKQTRMAAEAARGEEPQEDVRNRKSGLLWRVFSILAGVLAPLVFLLTENMRNPMVLVDHWTLLMVVILAIQLICMLLVRYVRNRKGDTEEQTATE